MKGFQNQMENFIDSVPGDIGRHWSVLSRVRVRPRLDLCFRNFTLIA